MLLKSKKVLSLVLAAIVTAGTLTGCGVFSDDSSSTASSSSTDSSQASEEAKGDVPELASTYKEFEKTHTVNITWFEQGWTGPEKDKDIIAPEIAKRTNLTMEYTPMTVPTGDDYNQKLNLMMASNEVPDFFFGGSDAYTKNIYQKLGDSGKIWDIGTIIKDYPNLYELLKPELQLFNVNGTNYFVPTQTGRGNDVINEAPHGLMLREDFLAKLGMDYPKNSDELYTYFKRCKEEIKVNDQAVIPYVLGENLGGIHSLYEPFMPFGGHELPFDFNDNFKVKNYRFTNSPELMEAAKYVSKLYREGYIDKEALTLKAAQVQEKISSGRAGGMNVPWWDMNTYSDNAKADVPDIMYSVIPPIYNNEAIKATRVKEWTNWIGCWSSLIISKTVDEESLRHVLAVMDYLSTKDGQMLTQAGIEGVTYEFNADGKFVFTDDFKQKTNDLDWNKAAAYGVFYYSQLVFNLPAYTDLREESPSLVREDNKKGWENQSEYRSKYNPDMVPTKDYYYLAGPVEEGKMPAIRDAEREFWAKVLVAKSDDEVTKLVNEWDKTCKSLGIDDVIKEKQEGIDNISIPQ